MKFDEVLEVIGTLGPYQKKLLLFLGLPAICCGLHKFAWVFLGATPPHRCRLPFEFDNASYDLPENILNMSYPWDPVHDQRDRCRMLEANYTQEYYDNNVPSPVVSYCHRGYVYDKSVYQSSVSMDWDLVCGRNVIHATNQALFMVGVLVGSFGFGAMSDKFGRRPAFLLSLTLLVTCGILGGVIPDFISFTAMRMIVGASTSGVFLVSFVMGAEVVGPSKRILAGTMFQCFFAAGYLMTALFAYFIRGWQVLQVTISAIGIIFVGYWWIIPESPRWLVQKGRAKEAEAILERIAKANGTALPQDALADDSLVNKSAKSEKLKMTDLMKYPNLRKKSLIVFFNWLVISGVYYYLGLNTSNLGGNDYINFVIFAVTEIPAYTIGYLLLDRIGRRWLLCGSLFLGGAMLLIIPAFSYEHSTVIIVLAMIGKFGLTSAYNVIYIFSAELFPTVIRNLGLGASSVCARIGSIIASYMLLLVSYWRPLPLLIFGICSVVAGVLAMFLPETSKKRLPETIDDGEMFGKSTKTEFSPSYVASQG